jgi:alanine racemase
MYAGATGASEKDSKFNSIDLTRPLWMEVDLKSLDRNFRLIRDMVDPSVDIIPCVKGAAFGLGLSAVSRRLVSLGVKAMFCGAREDAEILRHEGITNTDLVIFGSTLPAGIPSCLSLNLIPTVHTLEIADAVSSCAIKPTRVYVKIDSGRGRLGIPIRVAEEAILQIARKPNVIIEGIYTHLPFTDTEVARWAQDRTELFDDLIDRLRRKGLSVPVTQARSSSGILFGIRDRCNAVAPGSILYGKNSLPDEMVDFSNFRPLLSAVRTQLIHISPDAADRTPGVFGRYAGRVTGATGVIPFGRMDGHAAARTSQKSFVIVKGAKAPVLSVSTEHAVLDLSAVDDPKLGDEVTIIGRSGELEITLADLALWQDAGMNDALLMLRGRMPHLISN